MQETFLFVATALLHILWFICIHYSFKAFLHTHTHIIYAICSLHKNCKYTMMIAPCRVWIYNFSRPRSLNLSGLIIWQMKCHRGSVCNSPSWWRQGLESFWASGYMYGEDSSLGSAPVRHTNNALFILFIFNTPQTPPQLQHKTFTKQTSSSVQLSLWSNSQTFRSLTFTQSLLNHISVLKSSWQTQRYDYSLFRQQAFHTLSPQHIFPESAMLSFSYVSVAMVTW